MTHQCVSKYKKNDTSKYNINKFIFKKKKNCIWKLISQFIKCYMVKFAGTCIVSMRTLEIERGTRLK